MTRKSNCGTVTEAIKGLCFACYRERRQEG